MVTYYDFIAVPPTSEWFPTDVGGCVFWLPPDYIIGLNNEDPIANFNDESALGNDAFQNTESDKPIYYTDRINGQPAIYYDGITKHFNLTSPLGGTKGYLFFVIRPHRIEHVQANYHKTLFGQDASGDRITLLSYQPEAVGAGRIGNCNVFDSVNNSVAGSTRLKPFYTYLAMFRSDGSAWSLKVNQVNEDIQIVAGSNIGEWFGNIADPLKYTLGCYFLHGTTLLAPYKGDMGDVVGYQDVDMSAENLILLEQFLIDKYSGSQLIVIPPDVKDSIVWLPTDYLTGYSDNDPIGDDTVGKYFFDQSGYAYDYSQNVSDKRPLYKTNRINGKPSVLFDGTDDWVGRGGSFADEDFQFASGFSIYTVANVTDKTNWHGIWSGIGTQTGCLLLFNVDHNSGSPRLAIYHSSFKYADANSVIYGEWHLYEVHYDGTNLKFYRDGSPVGIQAVSIPNETGINFLFLGAQLGANCFKGEIAETFVRKGTLSDSEITAIRNIFNANYFP